MRRKRLLKLYEYEAKNILKRYGLTIPKGTLITNSSHAMLAAAKLKPPLAVKAQVLVAGRGKAGGIMFADSAEAAEKTAEKLLKTDVKGILVKKVLIEEKQSIKKELYCGVTLDRFSRSYVFIASTAGGMEIEENAEKTPQAIQKAVINPQQGFHAFEAR
jgi:succinyl-CoA synthetase beta subunit